MQKTEGKVDRIIRFILEKNSWIQISVFAVTLAVSTLFGLDRLKDSSTIVALLVLTCVELMLFLGVHFPLFKRDTKFEDKRIEVIESAKFDIKGSISTARSDVFVSGSTLGTFMKSNMFADWPGNVELRMVSLNYGDNAQLDAFCATRGVRVDRVDYKQYLTGQYNSARDSLREGVKERRTKNTPFSMTFAYSSYPMTTAFIAVDIRNPNQSTSFIKASYYVYGKHAYLQESSVSILVKPGNCHFAMLKEQIENLWDTSIKYSIDDAATLAADEPGAGAWRVPASAGGVAGPDRPAGAAGGVGRGSGPCKTDT